MSNTVMLKRAFNQAVATGAVRFTDADTDLLVIKTYILDYVSIFPPQKLKLSSRSSRKS